ncbi:hypothetical protein BUALT_Bualt05G0080000 [Buddleja alternifolia]|uniref:Helicase ATP-binding domain-containing protein n=1 Tax=Buddleja alternifolia TaxID=168488 RepID=A0AAV6XIZ7_9LAMI|nr:hypothetical protein BUALT_Bualt05G0080000 [Buddleja alternifolia]
MESDCDSFNFQKPNIPTAMENSETVNTINNDGVARESEIVIEETGRSSNVEREEGKGTWRHAAFHIATPAAYAVLSTPGSCSNLRRHVAASLMQHHRSIEREATMLYKPVSPASYGSSMEVPLILLQFHCFWFSCFFEDYMCLEEQHVSIVSLIKALKMELNQARFEIKELVQDQQANQHEMDELMKHIITQDKMVRKNKEQDRINFAIQSVRDKLEGETKLRQKVSPRASQESGKNEPNKHYGEASSKLSYSSLDVSEASSRLPPDLKENTLKAKLSEARTRAKASSMVCSSSKSLKMKFLRMAPAAISCSEVRRRLRTEKVERSGVMVSGKNVNDSKFKPSPIQSQSWPFLLDGHDFIGIAATGSGKTVAFGVPAIMHVLGKRKSKISKKVNPFCLVLSPTRELAQQISDVLYDAGKPSGVKSVCIYGGTSKGPQISSLKSSVEAKNREGGEEWCCGIWEECDDSKFNVLNSCSESKLPDQVLECCKTFDKLSLIQSHSWPFPLDGRDFIGFAATGFGKTIAFGVPAIMHVLGKRKSKISKNVNPLCLVLSPTRELPQQLDIVFGFPLNLKATAEDEKLLSTSLQTIESFWLEIEGDRPFLLGNSKPSIVADENDRERILGPDKKVLKWIEDRKVATAAYFDEIHSIMLPFKEKLNELKARASN